MKPRMKEYRVELKNKKEKDQYEFLGKLMFIADEIYNARIEKGWSQGDLAKKIGTTQRIISNIENSAINPGTDLLLRLANALDLSFKYGNCFLVDNINHRKSGFWIDVVDTKMEEGRKNDWGTKAIEEDNMDTSSSIYEFALNK